jgi:tetratricopeptide (TPR) repeat protein
MSVERDLYGDEIWIPSKEDSAEAFNVYVDEVQRGVRPANGDLKIENGRVQVTGALGVMEINGILTKMMHDHDRLRHAFYVEESYVIPWMYPYLSPHGLIMKINKDRTPYNAKTAAKDADFWDWYTRRLLDDPMYRRDFAGQKSFSKLRAAIAGLYQKQGRYREGAQAFREACLLYPASPEATFRYAQECLLPFRRWDVVTELMDYTDRIDPKNKRTAGLRNYVQRLSVLTAEIERLEGRRRSGKAVDREIFMLSRCYFEIGRVQEAGQLVRTVAEKLVNADEMQAAAAMLMEAGLSADAEAAFNRYLKVNPRGDANAWADLAKLQHRSGRREAAQQSFIQGYQIDRQALFQRLQRDQELYEIAAPLFRRK